MSEQHEFKKIDDQTLLETKVLMKRTRLMRLFDFNARQVTQAIQSAQYEDFSGVPSTGGATVMNFSDVEGQDLIKQAHAKLVELGGNPAPLEDTDDGKRKHGKTPLKLG